MSTKPPAARGHAPLPQRHYFRVVTTHTATTRLDWVFAVCVARNGDDCSCGGGGDCAQGVNATPIGFCIEVGPLAKGARDARSTFVVGGARANLERFSRGPGLCRARSALRKAHEHGESGGGSKRRRTALSSSPCTASRPTPGPATQGAQARGRPQARTLGGLQTQTPMVASTDRGLPATALR